MEHVFLHVHVCIFLFIGKLYIYYTHVCNGNQAGFWCYKSTHLIFASQTKAFHPNALINEKNCLKVTDLLPPAIRCWPFKDTCPSSHLLFIGFLFLQQVEQGFVACVAVHTFNFTSNTVIIPDECVGESVCDKERVGKRA